MHKKLIFSVIVLIMIGGLVLGKSIVEDVEYIDNKGVGGLVYEPPSRDNKMSVKALDNTSYIMMLDPDVDEVTTNDSFGISVSSAGDINNDSYDDVIVGARYEDAEGTITEKELLNYINSWENEEMNNQEILTYIDKWANRMSNQELLKYIKYWEDGCLDI